MSDSNEDLNDNMGERWLAAELNRIWLLAERALRAFQKAQIRPQPNHPSMAEVEMTLSARRASRYGRATEPEDEQALSKALTDVEQTIPGLRKAAVIGKLTASLQLK